jgi:hypothetical protein
MTATVAAKGAAGAAAKGATKRAPAAAGAPAKGATAATVEDRVAALEKGAAKPAQRAASAASSSSSPRVVRAAMSQVSAKRLVVVGTIGAGVLTLVAAYRNPNPKRQPFRVVLGVFIAGVLLAVLAEVAPSLAAGFSMLMLATAAFVVGGDAWAGITAITAPTN